MKHGKILARICHAFFIDGSQDLFHFVKKHIGMVFLILQCLLEPPYNPVFSQVVKGEMFEQEGYQEADNSRCQQAGIPYHAFVHVNQAWRIKDRDKSSTMMIWFSPDDGKGSV